MTRKQKIAARKRHRADTITASAAPAAQTIVAAWDANFAITAEAASPKSQGGEAGAKDGAGAPRFSMEAYNGGPMRLNGYRFPVIVDGTGISAQAANLPIYVGHSQPWEDIATKMEQLLGQTDAFSVDQSTGQVTCSGPITGESDLVKQAMAHAKNGFKFQASINAQPSKIDFIPDGVQATVNGRPITGPCVIARAVTCDHIALVPLGADSSTTAKIAASAAKGIVMEFAAWLTATYGLTVDKLTAEQKTKFEGIFATISATGAAPVTQSATNPATITAGANDHAALITAQNTALAANLERIGKIQEAAKDHPTIAAQAVKENWTVDKTELEVLRASRAASLAQGSPATIVHGGAATAEVITAAACMSGGLVNIEKAFKPETLEAAHTRYRGRIGLKQMLIEAAYANGYSGGPFNIDSDLRGVLTAAFSTVSLPGILSNTANKFLLEGFMTVEDTWRQIAAIKPVKDFKQTTSYRLTGDMEYEELAPDGEIKHGTLGEQSFTNQAKTYAKMLAITRVMIINDDLGALSAVPRRLGRGAALKFNLVFWTAFMDNASFFATGNANYMSGGTTNLSVNSLTAAELLFLNQTDPDGDPLGLAPEILLVPNALNTLATSLTRDLELRDTTASTKYTTSNPHAGKFRPVRSSYLSNSTILGYSALAWHLLANPMNLATIEACFLNGQQVPIVETADADFNTLGVQMRGYHDFGVNKQETRAGVKSKGEA